MEKLECRDSIGRSHQFIDSLVVSNRLRLHMERLEIAL